MRARPRRLLGLAAATGLAWVGLAGVGCMNPSLPTDLLLNLPAPPAHDDALEAPEPTLVVLQHGLWRSHGAMWRLARTLRAHGYETLNFSYPSTRGTIAAHAERLERRLERHLAERAGEAPRLAFVGHSLGGLVIRAYLQRDGARAPWACVFVATPHRGAILARLRSESWWWPLVMGRRSALQLVPGDPFYEALEPLDCARVGVIYGGKGDGRGWNGDIPGDDDGTVGVAEAQLPEQSAAVRLRLGHTRIGFAGATLRQVLHFLRHERFDVAPETGRPHGR